MLPRSKYCLCYLAVSNANSSFGSSRPLSRAIALSQSTFSQGERAIASVKRPIRELIAQLQAKEAEVVQRVVDEQKEVENRLRKFGNPSVFNVRAPFCSVPRALFSSDVVRLVCSCCQGCGGSQGLSAAPVC